MDALNLIGLSLLIGYLAIKDVIGPLVKYVIKKKKGEDHSDDPRCPIGVDDKVRVLEIDLVGVKTRVASFSELLDEHVKRAEATATALDDKLDVVLAELKDFRESIDTRLRVLEGWAEGVKVHLDHLLKRRQSGN